MPTVRTRNKYTGSRKDMYPEEAFVYEEATDTYRCPAGKKLTRRAYHSHRHTTEYMAKKKDCSVCEHRIKCTRDNSGRSIQGATRKEDLDAMLSITQDSEARRDIKTRQHLMERSYARSTRFGFDRARWRGLWKVCIQEYLICALQNIATLIRYATKPTRGVRTASSKTPIGAACTHRGLLRLCGLGIYAASNPHRQCSMRREGFEAWRHKVGLGNSPLTAGVTQIRCSTLIFLGIQETD